MAKFDTKNFNAEVYGKYLETVPRVKQNKLLEAGILRPLTEFKAMFEEQAGGNYATIPMYGLIGGEPQNYDGGTDIIAQTTDTYDYSVVVVGRMQSWVEKDFAADLTGADFFANVAAQTQDYWDDVDQATMLATLKGIFAGSNEFVTKHTYDITGSASPVVDAVSLNKAMQKACGANKNIISVIACDSEVATNLEGISAVEYLKYTDAQGVERDLGLASWNGRLLLIDDDMPLQEGYKASTADAEGAIKVVADTATPGDNEIKLKDVKAAAFYPADVAAGSYVVAAAHHTSYYLGTGAFGYLDCGARVPAETYRDPNKNGGQDSLINRQRKIFAPYGFSFTKASMQSTSPTDAELEKAANWALVNNGSGKTIDVKAIPIGRIISEG